MNRENTLDNDTLTAADFAAAADALGCDVAAIRAVESVESRGRGLTVVDGIVRPIILFEGHHFYRLTQGAFARSHPHLCHPSWDRAKYTGSDDGEWGRLIAARKLARFEADMAASWGRFQIMGFNHAAAGFTRVADMINAMTDGARAQLMSFVAFCRHEHIAEFIRLRSWAQFARVYNGPAYRQNGYDTKLAAAYTRFAAQAA